MRGRPCASFACLTCAGGPAPASRARHGREALRQLPVLTSAAAQLRNAVTWVSPWARSTGLPVGPQHLRGPVGPQQLLGPVGPQHRWQRLRHLVRTFAAWPGAGRAAAQRTPSGRHRAARPGRHRGAPPRGLAPCRAPLRARRSVAPGPGGGGQASVRESISVMRESSGARSDISEIWWGFRRSGGDLGDLAGGGDALADRISAAEGTSHGPRPPPIEGHGGAPLLVVPPPLLPSLQLPSSLWRISKHSGPARYPPRARVPQSPRTRRGYGKEPSRPGVLVAQSAAHAPRETGRYGYE
jgi:hypothetical protein